MNRTVTICDLDTPNTVMAKVIFALAGNNQPVIQKKDWDKIVNAFSHSYGHDMAYVTDGGKFVEQSSSRQVQSINKQMRETNSVPFSGTWYPVIIK